MARTLYAIIFFKMSRYVISKTLKNAQEAINLNKKKTGNSLSSIVVLRNKVDMYILGEIYGIDPCLNLYISDLPLGLKLLSWSMSGFL